MIEVMYVSVPTCILPSSQRGIPDPYVKRLRCSSDDEKGPKWIDTAPDLEAAKLTVQQRLKFNRGRYLIFNQKTQEKVLIESSS
jgi:hypothetical protein